MNLNAIAILKKDWQSELRTRYAVNSLGMFILVTISVILFAIGQEKISAYLTAGLFWVAIFFSAMSGLARAFVSEEERGTVIALKLLATPGTVFLGKLLYNLILAAFINLSITFLFSIFFESFVINNILTFIILFLLGTVGIAVSSTTIAAIIAKASSKGNLYAVLSFPILLPLILILLQLTKQSMDGELLSGSQVELGMLISYDVIMFTAGFLLFDFIWKD